MKPFLARARTALRTAIHLVDYGDHVAAGSRAYYALFDAMRAVLEGKGIDTANIRTHHGLILTCEQNVVRPGGRAREVASAIQKAAELRRDADYNPEGEVSETDVRLTLERVSVFIEACAKLVEAGPAAESGSDPDRGPP
jgi:uncharacterized protein (UPF0332 family)